MSARQRLRIVPSQFVVEHLPNSTFPEDDDWIALVRAPEGLTAIREAPGWVMPDHVCKFFCAVKSRESAPGFAV